MLAVSSFAILDLDMMETATADHCRNGTHTDPCAEELGNQTREYFETGTPIAGYAAGGGAALAVGAAASTSATDAQRSTRRAGAGAAIALAVASLAAAIVSPQTMLAAYLALAAFVGGSLLALIAALKAKKKKDEPMG